MRGKNFFLVVVVWVLFGIGNLDVFGFDKNCRTINGNLLFDTVAVNVQGNLAVVADGLDDRGRFAGLDFIFPETFHLIIGEVTEDGSKVTIVKEYGTKNYFYPQFITKSGFLVGYNYDVHNYNYTMAAMFNETEGPKEISGNHSYPYIIGAEDDGEKIYLLNVDVVNNQLVLQIVSSSFVIEKEIFLPKENDFYYEKGGLLIKDDLIYCVIQNYFYLEELNLQFLTVIEVDLMSHQVKDYYFLSDESGSYDAVFGGLSKETSSLFGRINNKPFSYSLAERSFIFYKNCGNCSSVAKGMLRGYVVGEVEDNEFFIGNEKKTRLIKFSQFDDIAIKSISLNRKLFIKSWENDGINYFYLIPK